MAPRGQNEEDWDNPNDDEWNSGSEDFDSDDDDESASTMACPYCQAEIHEESLRCPFCENYLSREDSPPQRRPLWVVVGIVLCLGLVVLWILL